MQRGLNNLIGGQHGGHPAVVVHFDVGHLPAAPGGRFQCLGEGQHPGGDERAVLAQRVAHDHVGGEAIVGQQPANGLVQRQHGRLGDFGLHQVEVGLVDGRLVVAVDEQVAAERAAEDGLHDGIGLVERGLHRRRDGGQFAAHVDVLAALAGEEEGQLARFGAPAAEDALRFHRLPRLRRVEAHDLARLLQSVEQFVVVAEVDDQTLVGADVDGAGQGARRRPARFDADQRLVQLCLELIRRVCAEGEDAADGSDCRPPTADRRRTAGCRLRSAVRGRS